MKCPKCNLEIDENIMSCPMCREASSSEGIEREQSAGDAAGSALLMTAKDDLQANIIESLLDVYGIPMRKVYKGNDTFGKIIMGLTVNGIDIYVPQSALEEARGIIANEMPEELEEEFELDVEETEVEEEQARKESFEDRRRARAWLALLIFVPGILVLTGVAVYWIIKAFM